MASTASVVIGHEAVPLHQITPIGGCVGAGNGKPTLVALFRPDDSDNVMAVTASRQTREVHAASRLTLSEPLAHKVPNATEASDALTVLRKWLQEQKEITRTGGRKARGCRIDPAVSPEPTVPTVPKADKTPANAPANAPAKARARSKPPYKTKDRASDKGKEMVDLAKTRRYSEITSTSRNGDGWLPGEQVDICLAYLGKPTTGGIAQKRKVLASALGIVAKPMPKQFLSSNAMVHGDDSEPGLKKPRLSSAVAPPPPTHPPTDPVAQYADSSGRPYWHNSHTGTTSYDEAVARAPPPPPPQPPQPHSESPAASTVAITDLVPDSTTSGARATSSQ